MAMLATSSTASEPMRLLLVALLACAAAGASVCDMANCGRGNCAEAPELNSLNLHPKFPRYECHCDPGWSQAVPLEFAPISPCMVPNCSFDGACLNISRPPPPTQDALCAYVNCGVGGACKIDDSNFLNYTCECKPGYANLLNLTALPCAKNNCPFGKGCSALGLAPAPAPASQPSPSPTGNDLDSSGTSAPPAGTKGSIPSRRLLQLLLLVTLAMEQLL